MVFGTFDGLHEGHRALFREAKKYGDYLIAVVAQDGIVAELKGRGPRFTFKERFEALGREDGIDEVIEGDSELGTWEVIKKYQPDVIALGYDQAELKKDLETHLSEFDWHLEIMVLPAHEPTKFKSSLLNKK